MERNRIKVRERRSTENIKISYRFYDLVRRRSDRLHAKRFGLGGAARLQGRTTTFLKRLLTGMTVLKAG